MVNFTNYKQKTTLTFLLRQKEIKSDLSGKTRKKSKIVTKFLINKKSSKKFCFIIAKKYILCYNANVEGLAFFKAFLYD